MFARLRYRASSFLSISLANRLCNFIKTASSDDETTVLSRAFRIKICQGAWQDAACAAYNIAAIYSAFSYENVFLSTPFMSANSKRLIHMFITSKYYSKQK